jgi:dihydrofolate reductase
MRKIIVSEFLTLDGVMEAPEQWQFPFLSPDAGEAIRQDALSMDAQLLGRVTYDIFAASWPTRTNNEFGIADHFNTMPKYVVSSTLQKADWNNSHIIKGNIAEQIAALEGKTNVIGSASLVQLLMQHDLVDEYQVMIHPIVLGHGRKLFEDGMPTHKLKLVDSRTFAAGVVSLIYQPDRSA